MTPASVTLTTGGAGQDTIHGLGGVNILIEGDAGTNVLYPNS